MTMGIVMVFLAFVFTLLEAIRIPSPPWVSFGWLGMCFWFASLLVGQARLL